MMSEVIGNSLIKAAEAGEKMTEAISETVEKAREATDQAIEAAREVPGTLLQETQNAESVVLDPPMEKIKEQSLSSLIASNDEISCPQTEKVGDNLRTPYSSELQDASPMKQSVESEKTEVKNNTAIPEDRIHDNEGLSIEQKEHIINETGWPSEIVDCIDSLEQYEIYKNANLKYAEIDGRPCLIKEIDMNYTSPNTIDVKNPNGLTNRQLIEKGRQPYDARTGEAIELHHMGQGFSSPFAELCENSEHGDGNDGILHSKKIESWRRDPTLKNYYNNVDRPNHWKSRA